MSAALVLVFVLAAVICCFCIGAFSMAFDHFERLGESHDKEKLASVSKFGFFSALTIALAFAAGYIARGGL